MRRALFLTVLSSLACLTVSLGALAQDGQEEAPAQAEETPAQAEETPAPAPSPEEVARRARVVAQVGETTITLGEVEDAINQQSPFLRVRYRDPEQLRTFVQSMIRFELLARAAERADLGDDPQVQRVAKQNAVQQLIRRDFDERLTPESVPEADVQQYYDTHPEEFSREELRRAAHIQLASRDEAERLLTKARTADAREFRELAREDSLDPETRLRGGDLRYFDREGHARNTRDPQVDDGLAEAAFGLAEVGDVAAEPIQVGERWSILKLTGLRAAEHRTLEESAPTIRLRLWRQRRQQALEDLVTRLRTEAHVEPHYDRMRAIHLDPPEREDREGDEEDEDTVRVAPGVPSRDRAGRERSARRARRELIVRP